MIPVSLFDDGGGGRDTGESDSHKTSTLPGEYFMQPLEDPTGKLGKKSPQHRILIPAIATRGGDRVARAMLVSSS